MLTFRLLAACLLLPGVLRAGLTFRTVAELDTPMAVFNTPTAQAQGGFNVSYGLDAALVGDGRGSFYGVGSRYGETGQGCVYRVTTGGVKTILHAFNGADGEAPLTALCQGRDGAFYGTTSLGGANGQGNIFKIIADGTLTVLHDFAGNEGSAARGRLLLARDGHFYGTTSAGGESGQGTLYRFTSAGQLTVLHHFNSTSGHEPYAGVTQGPDGALYGTGRRGGAYGYGVIYRITTAGDYRVLRHFGLPAVAPASQIGKYEGATPRGELCYAGGGIFYGTCSNIMSYSAGTGANLGRADLYVLLDSSRAPTSGTIFRINTAGAYAVLYGFGWMAGHPISDGRAPLGGVTRGADGAFYGTAVNGGASSSGTIFRYVPGLAPVTTGTFTGANGAYPQCALCRDDAGNLWGVTNSTTQVGLPDPARIGTVFVLSAGRAGAKGTYLARVSDPGETHAGSGVVQITVPASGPFTSRVTFAGTAYGFVGTFDALGDFTRTIGRGVLLPPLVLALHLNLEAPVVDRIRGTLTAGALVLAVDLPRAPDFSLAPPSEAGSYTAGLAPPTTAGLPGGTGYATFSISSKGVVTIAGKLSDLTPFSASSRLEADGTFPLYTGLYAANARGSVRGDALLADLAASDATASLRWGKPPQLAGLYAGGVGTTLTFAASRYTAPPAFTRLLNLGDTLPNTALLLTQDSSLGPLVGQHPCSLLLNNAMQFPPTDQSRPVLSFIKTTGLFTGAFLQGGKSRIFGGVVLQKTIGAAGQYSDGEATHAVSLAPFP